MSDFVYLFRIGDLYKIGSTRNLQKTLKEIKPDETLVTLKTSDPSGLEARLFMRYKSMRIPETGYFRLGEEQIIDCKEQLGTEGKMPLSINEEFGICLNASLIISLIASLICLLLKLDILTSLSLGFAFGSIPMWYLVFSGGFGGYESNDLPVFSTWMNRFKALILALGLVFLSYVSFLL